MTRNATKTAAIIGSNAAPDRGGLNGMLRP
jgi:hypothetical protein